TIYAGTNHGLFRSDDRGGSWKQVKKEEKEEKEEKIEQSVAPSGAAPESASAAPENDPVNLSVPISSPPKATKLMSNRPVRAGPKRSNGKEAGGKAASASRLESKRGKQSPSELARSAKSAKQTGSTRPNESAKTTRRTRSTRPDESSRLAKQTKPSRSTKLDKPVKTAKPLKSVKPEGELLVDLQNQIFAILPFTPFNAATSNDASNGAGDSQAPSTRSDLSAQPSQSSQPSQPSQPFWMIASTWDGLFITEDEKKGWREIKFPKASERAGRGGD